MRLSRNYFKITTEPQGQAARFFSRLFTFFIFFSFYTLMGLSVANSALDSAPVDPLTQSSNPPTFIQSLTGPKASMIGSAAGQCGRQIQPDYVGRPRCAEAVRKMVACTYKKITGKRGRCDLGGGSGCHGSANGYHPVKDQRTNGGQCKKRMGQCGYKPVAANDKNCKRPGAVRVYNKTHTRMGSIHGHLEFVGLENGKVRYYSVYGRPKADPWPSGKKPDACYLPLGMLEQI